MEEKRKCPGTVTAERGFERSKLFFSSYIGVNRAPLYVG